MVSFSLEVAQVGQALAPRALSVWRLVAKADRLYRSSVSDARAKYPWGQAEKLSLPCVPRTRSAVKAPTNENRRGEGAGKQPVCLERACAWAGILRTHPVSQIPNNQAGHLAEGHPQPEGRP